MKKIPVFIIACLLGACEQGSEPPPSVDQAPAEQTSPPEMGWQPPTSIGLDDIKIGDDVRRLNPELFSDIMREPMRQWAEDCGSTETHDECIALLQSSGQEPWNSLDGSRVLYSDVDIGGLNGRVRTYFGNDFRVDLIDVNLGQIGQNSYESVLSALTERYGVIEADSADYEAYNSSTSACLASFNPDSTVVLAYFKHPMRYGPTFEAHVVYRSLQANNMVNDALQQRCLPIDASQF